MQFIKILQQQKVIINFDESVITGSTSRQFSWERKGAIAGRNIKQEVQGVSIMCAVSSHGDIFFEFLQGNNNQLSVQAFMIGLESHFSSKYPRWRESHVLLLDNCASHKTRDSLAVLEALEIPVIFSAPASFLAIPIEGVFAALKAVDFSKVKDPEPSILKKRRISKLTKKQILMSKVSQYLFSLS